CGGQWVAGRTLEIGRRAHPVGILPRLIPQVAPLLLGDAILLAQPIAVFRGLVPGDLAHRAVIGRGERASGLVPAAEAMELGHGDFAGGQGESMIDPVLGPLRSFPPLKRTRRQEYEGLVLPVDVPASRPLRLARRQGVVDLYQLFLLPPLAQEPTGGLMEARVRVVAIKRAKEGEHSL